ncbi:GNAT family N-acetyltransferase [Undibacterium sp. SXout20W]|uniref:GNAT family N-acetyltransferase n=1 Tax=Undibacterium sp. SXout20W TaxID=3413051 RepID=UPI003BF0909E
MEKLTYQVEEHCGVDEFRSLLISSGLAKYRPIDDLQRLESMLRNSNLVVTARSDGDLVGIARAVTDFSFCCYLSDLAISKDCQGRRIGANLIATVKSRLGPAVSLILSSVPESVGFYESIGMTPLPDCYRIRREI